MDEHRKGELLQTAVKAAEHAYAPYSNFRVGAAVLTASGKVFTGCNVENASYGLALCAERTALAKALSHGEREFVGLAVACVDAAPGRELSETMPCGACRQWIQELAPNAEILVAGVEGSFHIGDLLPYAFRLGPD